MIPVDWDARTPTATTSNFTLTLKTGVSVALQNRLTTLRLPIAVSELPPNYLVGRPHSTMRDPLDWHNRIAVTDEAQTIIHDLETLQDQLALLDREDYDPVPEFVLYKRLTARGMLRVIIAWGIVLNGSVAKHKRLGDFVFLLCLADELPDVLDDIFKIERWFEQDAPLVTAKPTRKAKPQQQTVAPDVAAQRETIARVLREMGVNG